MSNVTLWKGVEWTLTENKKHQILSSSALTVLYIVCSTCRVAMRLALVESHSGYYKCVFNLLHFLCCIMLSPKLFVFFIIVVSTDHWPLLKHKRLTEQGLNDRNMEKRWDRKVMKLCATSCNIVPHSGNLFRVWANSFLCLRRSQSSQPGATSSPEVKILELGQIFHLPFQEFGTKIAERRDRENWFLIRDHSDHRHPARERAASAQCRLCGPSFTQLDQILIDFMVLLGRFWTSRFLEWVPETHSLDASGWESVKWLPVEGFLRKQALTSHNKSQ